MRIFQVIPFFSPKHGGSSVACYHLSKELADRGHQVTVLTTDFDLNNEWVKYPSNVGSARIWGERQTVFQEPLSDRDYRRTDDEFYEENIDYV
jgi:glycogen synthase